MAALLSRLLSLPNSGFIDEIKEFSGIIPALRLAAISKSISGSTFSILVDTESAIIATNASERKIPPNNIAATAPNPYKAELRK
jgi:hypothetical protein